MTNGGASGGRSVPPTELEMMITATSAPITTMATASGNAAVRAMLRTFTLARMMSDAPVAGNGDGRRLHWLYWW